MDINLPNTPQNIVPGDENNLYQQFALIYEALRKIAGATTDTDTGTDEGEGPILDPGYIFNGILTYIQTAAPTNPPTKYLWVQNNIGGNANKYKFWFFYEGVGKLLFDSSATDRFKYFQKGAAWDCGGAVALVAADCKEVNVRTAIAGTIIKWTILSEEIAGDIEYDVWKTNLSNFPPTVANSIVGGDYPVLVAGAAAQKSNLSAWTDLNVSAGDIFTFKVRSVSTLKWSSIVLDIRPS